VRRRLCRSSFQAANRYWRGPGSPFNSERERLLDLRDDGLDLLREIQSLSNVPLIVTTDM
jgi:hypothetical protein